MKYSFMTFSREQSSWRDLLAEAAKLGYQGIEPRVESNHAHGIELTADAAARREIRRQADEAGIAICCIATSCWLSSEGHDQVAKCREYIELAADVGCSRLRVFGGDLNGRTQQQAQATLAGHLRELAEPAQKRGVRVCIETHDSWTNPSVVAEVMQTVNHPAIGVTWDIMHPLRQSDVTIEEAYRTLKPWIGHVHVHDGSLDKTKLLLRPIGTAGVDHRAALMALKRGGYDGYISGEWIKSIMEPEFFARHLGQEINTLKEIEAAL